MISQVLRMLLYATIETVTGLGWSLIWSTPIYEPWAAWLFFVAMLLAIYGKLDALKGLVSQ